VIKESIEQAVKAALTELGAGDASFVVSRPIEMAHGDFATNAALSAAKLLKKNPKEVAELLVEDLHSKNIADIEKIEVAGAGFINFFVTRAAIEKEVYIAATDDSFGDNNLYTGKRVMVEYTDPNPFKEFHIGHLMSNAIGESIARLLEHSGATVVRANYQGDVGPHVAKALFVLLEKNIDNPSIKDISAAYVEGAKRYEENVDDKAAIDQLNKAIYEKTDEKVNALYAKGRALSLEHFEELYKILGTKFDFYFFESETASKGLEIVKAHPEIFVQSEGAIVFRGESYGLHTRVFVNKLGLPTYEAKDMGLVVMKKEKAPSDEYIYITANEQNDYFKVIFVAAKLVFPQMEGKLIHRSHGMMRLAQGKMSSRLGNVVTGESLLISLMEVAKEKMQDRKAKNPEQVAREVAVGALKYVVLRQGTGKDIIFDPEKSLSIDGDSGPYLQYAHTRALSLIKMAREAGIEVVKESASSTPSALERLLIHFPNALSRAAQELEPHHLTTYLTELASTFNSWYASERLIGGNDSSYGLLLAEATEKVLARGLEVLGIRAPEEM